MDFEVMIFDIFDHLISSSIVKPYERCPLIVFSQHFRMTCASPRNLASV